MSDLLIVLRRGASEADYDLRWPRAGSACVADLLEVLEVETSQGQVWIDGAPVPTATKLADAGLGMGSILEPEEPSTSAVGVVLEVVGGPSCGQALPLRRTTSSVGTSVTADLSVDDPLLSGHHFSIRRRTRSHFEVTDLDSGAGTWTGDQPATGDHGVGDVLAGGSSLFRLCDPSLPADPIPSEPRQLHAPAAPAELGDPQPLPWVSIGAPVALGIGLAWLFHPMMILIGIMSPVMVLAGWLERRRQQRRQERARSAEWARRLEGFETAADAAHRGATALACATHPGAAALLRQGVAAAPADRTSATAATGRCEDAWTPSIQGPSADHPDIAKVIRQLGPLCGVPATLEIRPGDRVSIVGPQRLAEALCRWLIIQLALATPSSRFTIDVGADPADPSWRWLSRLPHCSGHGQEVIAIGCPAPHPTIQIRAGEPATGDGIDVAVAGELARRIAQAESHRTMLWGEPGLSLNDALEVDALTPESVLERWGAPPSSSLPMVLGLTGAGVLWVDLVDVGPHALIAGTTGAGKSELLKTMIATTAAQRSPAEVNFVLIDYKGGSAFDACAGLPHVVGVVTDLDQYLAERALRCLDSELRFREAQLRAAGVNDIAELRGARLPRLCVVIDELATLAAELPVFTERLVGVAQRGRSLGVHLILATQRPGGAVSPAIRTNTNLRICLRVPDPLDSEDVIGDPVAATIPRGAPGRAWIRCGPDELIEVQGFNTSAGLHQGHGIVVATPAGGRKAVGETDRSSARSGLDVLVGVTKEAWSRIGGQRPRRPWPDPLPSRVELGDLPSAEHGVTIGLVDDPDNQRIDGLHWEPGAGHLVVVGGPRSGRTTALLTAAQAVATTPRREVIGIDAGGGDLGAARGWPRCTALCDLVDLGEVLRLFGELIDRARGPAMQDVATSVIVIDNLGALLQALESGGDYGFISALGRLWSDGPARGIAFAVSADRPAAVPRDLAAATATHVMLALNDPFDYLGTGISVGTDRGIPGRGHETRSGRCVQLAQPLWA